eukprot:8975553-Pyramimonas_sp.AAC.1
MRPSASCAMPWTRSGQQASGLGIFDPRSNVSLEEQRGQGTGGPQPSRGPICNSGLLVQDGAATGSGVSPPLDLVCTAKR